MKPPSYSALLEAALRVEECLTEKDVMLLKKRKSTSEYGGLERKGRDVPFKGSRFHGSRNFRIGVNQQSMSRSVTISSGRSGRGGFSQGRAESKRSEGSVSVSQGYRSPCARCGRFYSGECWGPRQILCFYYGKLEHMARDYWSKNRASESQVIWQSKTSENMTQGGVSRGRGRGMG